MSRGAARRLTAIVLCTVGVLAVLPAPGLAVSPPALSVNAAALVAQDTGQRLYGVHPQAEVAIASATKLMTALLTLESVHHLGARFTQNNYYPASTDSQIGLVPGERMSVHDLLLALMLPSADDAAEDLAYNVGHGSVTRFIAMMNARALQLGLRHTHYSTPSGLDTPGNYSSAADLVKLAIYDLTHSRYFARIVALPSALLRSGNSVRYVVNRNTLVGTVPWITGVKTGHTAAAGYVLVASGHRDGMTLVDAVLGTASEQARNVNALALLNYGFRNFHLVTPVRAGAVLARLAVRQRPRARAVLVASRSFTQVLPRRTRLEVRIEAPRRLGGPMRRSADVGTAVVLADGRPIARIPLLLARALPAVSGATITADFMTKPLVLVIVAVALGALVARVGLRRRRSRDMSGDWEAA